MDQSPLRTRAARLCATLTGTLRYRPVVLDAVGDRRGLMVPFYMFSQRELAPAEDQGVVFGVIQASPNSTIDQTKLFTNEVYDVYHVVPGEPRAFSRSRLRPAASAAW